MKCDIDRRKEAAHCAASSYSALPPTSESGAKGAVHQK
jgi:hypothetical protein